MQKRNRHDGASTRRASSPSVDTIYGVHAVSAALANHERSVIALFATRNGHDRLLTSLDKLPVTPSEISPADLSKRLGADAVHQGVMVEVEPLAPPFHFQLAIKG